MIVQQLAVYPNRSHPPAQIYAVQGEAGSREIRLVIYDGSKSIVEGGAFDTAYAYVQKNDGTIVAIQCSGGNAQYTTGFTLPLQACTVAGNHKVYIQLVSAEGDLRFDNLTLFVEPCNFENALESTSDLGALAEILGNPGMLEEVQNTYNTVITDVNALMEQVKTDTTALMEKLSADVDAMLTEGNALLEDLRNTDVGTLNEDLNTHTANTTIHLTAGEKKFLSSPVLIQDYIGNGDASRDIKMLVTYPSFIIVWAQGLAPMNKKGDLEKYSVNWGIASNFATNRFYYSAGLKITQNGVLTVLKDTDDAASTSTLSFNLNQKYITYHIAYFGPYTT